MKETQSHAAHSAGKGSIQRPTDQTKFAEGYDRIFGKKDKPNPELYKQTSWCEEDSFDKNVSTVVD